MFFVSIFLNKNPFITFESCKNKGIREKIAQKNIKKECFHSIKLQIITGGLSG